MPGCRENTVSETKTTLDLIRHGAPVGGKKFRGSTDDPLSEDGWRAMQRAVGDYRDWDHIVTSPLSRCAAFANHLHDQTGIPLSVHADLREVTFGAWEGMTAAQVIAAHGDALARYWDDADAYTPPGAEPVADFTGRVAAATQHLAQTHRGRRVLVVAHAGTMRAMLAALLGLPLKTTMCFDIPYACLSRVVIYGDGDGGAQNAILRGHGLQLDRRHS